jgi:hypothetical protein
MLPGRYCTLAGRVNRWFGIGNCGTSIKGPRGRMEFQGPGSAAAQRSTRRWETHFQPFLALDGTTCNAMAFFLAENLEGNPSQSRSFEERRFSCGARPGRAAMFLLQWKSLTSKASVKCSEAGRWNEERGVRNQLAFSCVTTGQSNGTTGCAAIRGLVEKHGNEKRVQTTHHPSPTH